MTQSILVPIDFSDVTSAVIQIARDLVQSTAGEVRLLHVVEPAVDFPIDPMGLAFVEMDTRPSAMLDERERLETWCEHLRKDGVVVAGHLVTGIPAASILAEAEKCEPRFIVMGSHGHGALHHLLLGGVTEDVLRQTRWSVVVVSSKVAPSFGKPTQSALGV